MKITRKLKLFILVISLFISGHAPWGQHEVYRQMHMLVMCTKTDKGAFDFTKNLKVILDEYLPEAKARVARARDSERLVNLLITNQIPLAIISDNLLIDLKNEKSHNFQNLLKHSKTLYSFENMILVVNHDFKKEYMEKIIDSLDKASKNNNDEVKFIKKNNLVINYDKIVLEKIKF
ncbi:MAG: hypothetical protein CMP40_01470 [Rickettsiales bacterium]|nr:hypothetical protein [Rickettsiales bacterium]